MLKDFSTNPIRQVGNIAAVAAAACTNHPSPPHDSNIIVRLSLFQLATSSIDNPIA